MRKREFFKPLVLIVLLISMLGCKKSNNGAEPEPPQEEGKLYELSNEIFPNPERGFVRTLNVKSEGNFINVTRLAPLRDQNISMVVRVFYLEAFRDKALSQKQLDLLQSDFNRFREYGLKIIPRFAYAESTSEPDAPFSIVEQHLNQLKPLLEANKDIIAFMQAGFIGAYGEWHASTNSLDGTKVMEKILNAVPQDIMIQIRRPLFKQQIFRSTWPVTIQNAYSGQGIARVGHHNDCFMSGGTNYGTYSNILNEKQYISNDALYVPTGGETCPPTGGYDPNCSEGQTEMKLLKWTYLNLDYYQPTLDAWRASGCFDDFQKNLGYRLALVNSIIPGETSINGNLELTIGITNHGFAPLYNRKITSLVLQNKSTQEIIEFPLAFDIRSCKPGGKVEIKDNVKLQGVIAGDYDLYLKISDQSENLRSRKEYSVRLANKAVWTEDNGGMNDLHHTIKVK